jgi:hypothetical protein
MSIRNLNCNNIVVSDITFNSSQANIVNFKGVTVYDNTQPDTVEFELYPEFVSTHTDILYPRVPSGNTYSLPSSFYLMGNSNFFIRTKAVNTGEITITRSYNSIDYPYRIDNYGYGFMRAIFYDRWPGGQTQTYGSTVTFTPENDPTQAKTIKFLSEVDENNTEFQKGLLLSRLLRIPSSGLTGDIKMYFFPYSFDSSLFYDDIKCMVIDCSQVGDFDSNSNIIRYPTITGVEPTNLVNNVFLEELLPTRVGATELNLHYKAGANNSADYKYAFVAIDISNRYSSYNNMTASKVHFIQEPYSANRVYYGDVPKDAKWWEAYADSSDSSQRYHYMFQFTNSEILTGSREVTCASLKQNVPIQTVILVPTVLPHTITSETGSYSELTNSEHYYWGTQEYTIYNLTTSNAVYTIQIL